MTPLGWPCPLAGHGLADEYALTFDRARPWRLLIVPALFDEGNRMRRLTVEVMRRLDGAGIDSFLVDPPGLGESLQALEHQTPESWRAAMAAARTHFAASHVLGVRGGALIAPEALASWHYAPLNGASQLRQMLRARIVAAREIGSEETQQSLMEEGLATGLELAGYRLGPEFLRQFQSLTPPVSPHVTEIAQATVGGSGLWLRSEPDEDRAQADALAAVLAIGIKQ